MKRVCLLTGASGLLGTTFSERFASCCQIVAVRNRNEICFATQEQVFVNPLFPEIKVPANDDAVYAIRADLSKPVEIDCITGEVLARFGGVDLLINAAGLSCWAGLVSPSALDLAEAILQVNVLAPLRLSVGIAQKFWQMDPAENLRLNRNIVNVSSAAGVVVYPDVGQAIYATSKAALNHLTYHLASEFWDMGIRFNAVAPDAFPGRASAAEVVESIVGLDCSEQTGQIVPIPP